MKIKEEELKKELKETLDNSFDNVWDEAQRLKLSLRDAAYIVAIKRIVEAIKLRGQV